MIQVALWCAVLLASLADPTSRPETVIRLTVDAMPAPKPALRYLLLPELREMNPGNPIPNYLKCLLDQDFTSTEEKLGRSALKQADRAARMDKPDWQILPKLRTDGISLLLPDLQKMRSIAQALQERFRSEVEQRRFDDCARDRQDDVRAVATHGRPPNAHRRSRRHRDRERGHRAPRRDAGAAGMPEPLLGTDQPSRCLLSRWKRDWRASGSSSRQSFAISATDRAMSEEQIKKLVKHIDYIRGFEPDKLDKTRVWLDARIKDEKYLAQARVRLVEYGLNPDRLARFPADQVILLDEKREYEVERDEAIKYMKLPTWQALSNIEKLKPTKEAVLFGGLVPALQKVRRRRADSNSGWLFSATSRHCAFTPRPTAGVCPRVWKRSRCRCRPIRLRASRSATS